MAGVSVRVKIRIRDMATVIDSVGNYWFCGRGRAVLLFCLTLILNAFFPTLVTISSRIYWDVVHDFSLRTQHCRHVYNCYWSGVFNLLEFDHTLKKKIIAIHSICWVDRDQISAWGFEIVVTEVLRSCGEGGVYKTTYFCAICFVASLGWISPTAKCWTLVVVSVCRFSVKHIRCKRRVYFHNTESVQCISIR